jgi:hypothetical protein
MDVKKVLPVFLAVSISGEAVLLVRHSDTLAPEQPHTEVKVPSGVTVSAALASASGGGPATRAELTYTLAK